jgi:hypothetical protein
VNPVGTFSVATEVNGGPVTGTLTIGGAAGAYAGSFTSDALPELPVSKVTVKGPAMTMQLESPQGTVVMTLTFTGNDYTGQWELGGQTGAMKGKRIK